MNIKDNWTNELSVDKSFSIFVRRTREMSGTRKTFRRFARLFASRARDYLAGRKVLASRSGAIDRAISVVS